MQYEVDLDKLEYGCYELTQLGALHQEAKKYSSAEFNKLHVVKVRLPMGKNNLIYLLTETFQDSLNMINSKHFLYPPTYKKIYYPVVYNGSFFGRRFRIQLTKARAERMQMIREQTKLIHYPTRVLAPSSDNIFFVAADLYSAIRPIAQKFPIKRLIGSFFKDLNDLMLHFTPEAKKMTPQQEENPDWGNRILIIDAEKFQFKMGGSLDENKTNPLFLLYLAYFRLKDLTAWEIDRDIMITSHNRFMKFNPSKMDPKNFNRFRAALFRMMNANLDQYTDQLSDEEKDEVMTRADDEVVSAVVDKTVNTYTQYNSPAVKTVVGHVVANRMMNDVQARATAAEIITTTQDGIAKQIGDPAPGLSDNIRLFDKLVRPHEPLITELPPEQRAALNRKNLDDQKSLYDSMMSGYAPLINATGAAQLTAADKQRIKDAEHDINHQVTDVLINNKDVAEEIIDEIQARVVPMDDPNLSPVSSRRDHKLREAQKKVVVQNSTIEEILEMDASNVPIQTTDVHDVTTSSNNNMKNITFANFEKTYLEELYTKDIVSCFDMLKDKKFPFYVTNIEIRDSSSASHLKETWIVKLKDENNMTHTITVDIPKFYQDRFMLTNGNKYMILKQNYYLPVVKDKPDEAIVTTNYNKKITLRRKATKSVEDIERIFTVIRKNPEDKTFTSGDSTQPNKWFISSLEFDELSRRLYRFKTSKCEICFNREYIRDNMEPKLGSRKPKSFEFLIGFEGDDPIIIDENTGLDSSGRSICEIIKSHLTEEHRVDYESYTPGKTNMFVEATLLGQEISVFVLLLSWVGLSTMLNKMGISWEFHAGMKRAPMSDNTTSKWIQFSDGFLEYEPQVFAQLILNGIKHLKTYKKMTFKDFDTEASYQEYVLSIWGNFNAITQLKVFYEFLIDPITKEVCRDHMLPTEAAELIIHAVKLLADNKHANKADDSSYRTRSIEIVAAALYEKIANEYKEHVISGGKKKLSLPPQCIIKMFASDAVKTVEEYSTLNPAIEVARTHTISTKGLAGSNSAYAHTEEKRSYDPSSIGKIAMETAPSAEVGINRALTVEPTIKNARGYREPVKDIEELKDVNLFSPVELMTAGTIRHDDGIRSSIAAKQTQHLVPVSGAVPALVSNGFDEAIQFHLSNDFVINAEEDGKVIEINEKLGFVMVQYKSGKTQAINLKPEVVKNSGGGFFISNTLKATDKLEKVGRAFKRNEALAYHDKYFQYSKVNGLRYAIGPLVKVAFMSTYNTYEDAGLCTMKLSEQLKTAVTYRVLGKFKANEIILDMVKIGDTVNIGDALIKFDTSVDDSALAKALAKKSEENLALLEEEIRTEVKTDHAGKVIDIKVKSLHDPTNLSPSLGKIVQQYWDQGLGKKKFLSKYDSSEGILKAGYLLRDTTEPHVSRYGDIDGIKGYDVIIEFYIEHEDYAGVGDKWAVYSANKQIISELIPEGYEPYGEHRPDEEISAFTSTGTINRRMTPSVYGISAAMKCMVELKRIVGEKIKYSK